MTKEYVNLYDVHGRSLGATNEWQRVPDAFDYIIYKWGSLVKAKNNEVGKVEFKDIDAATVIQSPLDALYDIGGTIYIAKGVYEITSTLKIHHNINLIGAGRGDFDGEPKGTVLKLADNANTDLIQQALPTGNAFFTIANMTLNGNSANNTSGKGINLENCILAEIRNIQIRNFPDMPLRIYGGTTVTVRDVHVTSCPVPSPAAAVYIHGCNHRIFGLTVENITTQVFGAWISGFGHTVHGLYSESNFYGIKFDELKDSFVSGVFVESTTSAGGESISTNAGTLNCVFAGIRVDKKFYLYGDNNVVAGFTGTLVNNATNSIILDKNYRRSGTATFSGDGTTTDFPIGDHGLTITDPTRIVVKVTPISNDAIAASPCVGYVDPADPTKIRVKFASPPTSGTNNVQIIWEAQVV